MQTLSERERSVMALVAEGRGNKEIAKQLGVSVPTINTYVERVFTKLDVTTRTAAVVKLIRAGVISADSIQLQEYGGA